MPVTFRPMIRNFSSSFLIFSFVQMVSAQAPFSKWIVQSGDSVNTYALGHMDLVHLANNDLLQCTSRDAVGSLDKCRFGERQFAGPQRIHPDHEESTGTEQERSIAVGALHELRRH